MKILCISYEYPPVGGGGATVCKEINEALVNDGHEVHVVTSGMSDLPRTAIENGVHVHRVRCWRRSRYHSTAAELLTLILPAYFLARRITREVQFDCIHCHFIVPSGPIAYLLSRSTGLKYYLTAHGSDVPGYNPERFDLLHGLIRPLWHLIVTNAAQVTAPSTFLKQLIQSRVDVPVEVVPNGVSQVAPIPDNARRNLILVASRLVQRKGVQDLIQAMAGLETGWELLIVGDGPYLSEIKRIAQQEGVSASFPGLLSRDRLQELYRSAKIFVFPSHTENFPMVLLEAMAAECAVITTTAPGCLEVVGDAAILYPPGNVQALRAAVEQVVMDDALVADLQHRSRQRAKRFDARQIAAEYVALIETNSSGLHPASPSTNSSSRPHE